MTTPDLRIILSFLAELKQNNNKAWFDGHRQDYEAARNRFYDLLDDIIDEFRDTDHLEGLRAKDCVARINRDIRFSKDKSPYKTNFGAQVAPGGWKDFHNGYYFSLEPGGLSMVAGGLYAPSSEQLERFRQAIDANAARFKRIIQDESFIKTFGEVSGERLKTAPRGYDPSHPEIDLLKLKQVTVIRRFSDEEVMGNNFEPQAISACYAMRPFLDYLDRILGE